jgi:Ala-tRNA(Pro) deacylase
MQNILFEKLKKLGIEATTYLHEPLYTVEQAFKIAESIPGGQVKNLFLKDNKNNLYLIVAMHDTEIDLKSLSKFLDAPQLRFASADLLKGYLGVLPGSVTPFGLIFDKDQKVAVLLDSQLFNQSILGFHPLENNATTIITPHDLLIFITSCGNNFMIINFNEYIV